MLRDDIQLLPCPFCGSGSVDPKGWASTDSNGPACDDCGAAADSVEIWNQRLPPKPEKAENEDLEL